MSGTPEGERDASCDEAGQNSPAPSDNTSEGKHRHRQRHLTFASALEIFRLRPQITGPGHRRRGASYLHKAIAPQFGVSVKTVREIWAGRAWARATRPEWTTEEIAARASSISRMMRDGSAGGASNSSDTTSVLPALQHSLPGTLVLQQMQPAAPHAHTSSPTQFSGFQTAPPHTTWGYGAATQLNPAQDLESVMRSLQATLAQLLSQSQALQQHCQNNPHHFVDHQLQQQQKQQQKQHHAIERAMAAVLSFNHHAWRPS
jgi:hypothetical protein